MIDNTNKLKKMFIGSDVESFRILQQLVDKGLQNHLNYRKFSQKNQNFSDTETTLSIASTDDSMDSKLQQEYDNLLDKLNMKTVGFHRDNYLGHMLWQTSVPSILGYFSGLLHNQNNAGYDGGPLSTELEITLMKKFSNMFDFPKMLDELKNQNDQGNSFSWGHLTSGGNVSNCEAMWAARNLKFLPVSIKMFLESFEQIQKRKFQSLKIQTAGGDIKFLMDVTIWELFNLSIQTTLNLFWQVYIHINKNYDKTYKEFQREFQKYTLPYLGFFQFEKKLRKLIRKQPDQNWQDDEVPNFVLFCSYAAHYSISKAASLLGLGNHLLKKIEVDLQSRMKVNQLQSQLLQCAERHIPVVSVIAILGTTQSSAVDNIQQILRIKNKLKNLGLNFYLHVDGAYGAYFKSIINNQNNLLCSFKPYVRKQYECLSQVDSITFDPHKTGYIPYSCGGIIYRDYRIRNTLNFSAPYMFHETQPSMSIYGIEGSKSGASVFSAYLAHQVIPLQRQHHGEILEKTLFGAKIFFSKLHCFEKINDKPNKKFNFLTMKKDYQNYQNILKVATTPIPVLIDEFKQNKELFQCYQNIGPDLSIVCFSINFKNSKMTMNKSLKKINQMIQYIAGRCRPRKHDTDLRQKQLLVSNTVVSKISGDIVDKFCEQHSLTVDDDKLVLIRCTVMDPFFCFEERNQLQIIDKLLTQAQMAINELRLQ